MTITAATVVSTAGSVTGTTTVLGVAPVVETAAVTIPDGALLLSDTTTWLLFASGDYLQAET